jgi:hypothetical protein
MNMEAGLDERATNLEAESILAEAREKAGLADFGDESFREPMERLLRAMEEEAELTPAGRAMQRARVVGLLVNRLRAEDHFERFPEILAEKIREPLVIVGLARTGTTMLHRMIASDPRMISLLWWESRNPAPFPEAGSGGRDLRIADAEAEVAAMIEGAPDLVAMHPIEAEQPDEEIMLLEHSFFSTNPEAFANVPAFSAWLDEQDQTPGYRYLKKLLQFLQWQKKRAGGTGERWVLKTPHHLGFVDLLFAVFPDARIIQTHRDPIETVPSLASLIHAIRSLGSDAADPRVAGRQWSGRMSRALHRCMAVRESHADRFIDVWFEDAMRDPLAEIRRIYAFAGMELTSDAEAGMRRWAADNAREKRAAHSYTLEQFGLTEAGIRRDFAAYRERFRERGRV